MSNKKKTNPDEQSKSSSLPIEPWISMKKGINIIIITSIAMAVLTAIQVIPVRGWLEGIFWGLLFGGLIWAIFLVLTYVNRFLKR